VHRPERDLLPIPVTDVSRLVAAARAGIAEAPSAAFSSAAVLGAATKDVPGFLSFDGSTSSLTMVVDGSEIRVIGKKTFTHSPSGVPGKEWIGTDPDGAGPIAQAAGAGVPVIVKLPDLGRTLVEIERTGRIVSAEQTRLGDLPVNHYRLELDAAKAPELFPEFAVPGKPVDIQPPPADQVVDLSELLEKMGT
jgi:hypothetical protein